MARAVGVAPSYVSRLLRLTLLGPDILEAILDGWQPFALPLGDLLNGLPFGRRFFLLDDMGTWNFRPEHSQTCC